MPNAARQHPDLRYAASVPEAADGADLVLHLTEWADYRAVDPAVLGRSWPAGPSSTPGVPSTPACGGGRLVRARPRAARTRGPRPAPGIQGDAKTSGSTR